MRHFLKLFIVSTLLLCVFFALQNNAVGTPSVILIDEKPKVSTGNPLLPEADQLMDFAKVNVATILSATKISENKVEKLLAQISAVAEGKRTFSNTMLVLDEIYNTLQKQSSVYELISETSIDAAIRDTAGAMMAKFYSHADELMQNEPLYKAIKSYSQTAEAIALTGERAYFLKHVLLEFNLNGMALSAADRDTLKSINSKLNEWNANFGKNIAGDKTKVTFNESELDGLQKDFIMGFINAEKKYSFDLSLPTYLTFMSDCKNSESRKQMYLARMNVGGEPNEKLLVDIIKFRTHKAKLLGFKTYSEYATSDIMAQNTANVWKFEKGLAKDLRTKAVSDLELMQNLKMRETGMKKTDFKPQIFPYDAPYYSNMELKEKYNVDNDKVKEYFEMKNVLSGIFTVYQKLYNLRFVEDLNPSVWYNGVTAFTVFDNATNERIGYFYLDLYPRPDKYNHFGCFGLTGSKKFADGKKQLKCAALVCNFPPANSDKPSLLPHSQVLTFFHEFGHLIHIMLSETELAAFAGTNVATDFVEAPSQIMENWAWKKDVLSLFAKHYKTGEVIPDSLLNNMIAARNMNSGLITLQQVYYGTLDFTLNDGAVLNSSNDVVNKTKEIQNSVTLYPWVEGTHFAGSFSHLTGYGSKYYGYLWSLVYAADMFSVFEKTGPLNPENGIRYRENVLSKGGSDDAIHLVTNFLGRESNNKAFLKQIGL